jgi:hypothetical protein
MGIKFTRLSTSRNNWQCFEEQLFPLTCHCWLARTNQLRSNIFYESKKENLHQFFNNFHFISSTYMPINPLNDLPRIIFIVDRQLHRAFYWIVDGADKQKSIASLPPSFHHQLFLDSSVFRVHKTPTKDLDVIEQLLVKTS